MAVLKIGDSGPQVKRLQTLLNGHGYHLTADGSFGALTGSAIVEAKHALGYPAKQCLPFAGDRFIGLISRKHGPLRWAVRRIIRKLKPNPAVTLRGKVVTRAYWGLHHAAEIHYAETRPMAHWLEPLPVTVDCSTFATLCYKHAGAPDPNGLGYNGTGYTGTLLDHGKHVWRPQPGDLVIYGPGAGVHVAVVVEGGNDPLTVSEGDENGPELVRVSQDNRQPIRYRSYL